MSNIPKSDNARVQAGKVGKAKTAQLNPTPPIVAGQCGQVLGLIQQYQPLVSLRLTADFAIPEAAARIQDLRAMGFNILTTIHPTVVFRGVERRNVACYSLGTPEWPRPGFFENGEVSE